MPVTESLAKVAEILRWNNAAEQISAWHEQYDSHLEATFNAIVLKSTENASVAAGFARLSPTARLRFLRAPQIVSRLIGARRYDLDIDGGFLAEALLAEFAAAGLMYDIPGAVWTARGDNCFTAQNFENNEPVDRGIAGIAIDDCSTQTFPYDGVSQKLLVPLDLPRRVLVRDKLSYALETLANASGLVFSFVSSFIDTIAVRLEPGEPTEFHSSSFSRYIGLALLTNPHLEIADMSKLTDALVHESIHNMLFMIEEMESPFLLMRESARVHVKSPWSGRNLNLNSYVHACAVWYGLYWFWYSMANLNYYPSDRCAALMSYANAGFAYRPASEVLAPARHLLSPEILGFLDDIESHMLSCC